MLRISKVDSKASTFVMPTIVAEESFEEIPVSQMRKTIARRLGRKQIYGTAFLPDHGD